MTTKTSIQQALLNIQQELPTHVQLVAVSKTKPVQSIEEAYATGQRAFGENKVQELVPKFEILPKDIQWHFIGHLQKNKIKYIIPFVHLIHGVDSISLLEEINKQAQKLNHKISVLLQVHIATEETKFGFSFLELRTLMAQDFFKTLKHVHIKGLMGMASFTTNTAQIEQEFASLHTFFKEVQLFFTSDFNTLSMGMSNDYKLAIQHGSTLVRIGSTIFGERK